MSQANRAITTVGRGAQVVALDNIRSIAGALDNERCKLGSFEELLSVLIAGADARPEQPNPFYALLDYIAPITSSLVQIGERLDEIGEGMKAGGLKPAKSDGSAFSAALAEFQESNAAYALASDDAEEDTPRAVYARMARARDALLATVPHHAEEARQLLAVCLAELQQDMTVGGPLPDAILAAMGASIRALAQPDPATDPAVIANAAYQAVEDEINSTPGDTSDALGNAMNATYAACMATVPITLAGVIAKLRAYARWNAGDDQERDAALFIADLERLAGKAGA